MGICTSLRSMKDSDHTSSWPSVLRTIGRIIFFRASQREFVQLNRRHLLLGLVVTLAVGIALHWGDPRAGLPQHLGVESVVYVFILASLLWVIIRPLRPSYWSY